ncbi:MAG: hypothetical protein ABSF00_08645 [Candidatus Bathyarchaeia archaeon]|jgi:ribosomal protein S27E
MILQILKLKDTLSVEHNVPALPKFPHREDTIVALDSELTKLRCPRCGDRIVIFYSSKTGDRVGWSCETCSARGFWSLGKAIMTSPVAQ